MDPDPKHWILVPVLLADPVVSGFYYWLEELWRLPCSGAAERVLLHAAVPVRGLLLSPQAQGAGVQVQCLLPRHFDPALVGCSVVDPNTGTLNSDQDPEFWPNLDPDPGLSNQILKKKQI